jgi:hypothetical protein
MIAVRNPVKIREHSDPILEAGSLCRRWAEVGGWLFCGIRVVVRPGEIVTAPRAQGPCTLRHGSGRWSKFEILT